MKKLSLLFLLAILISCGKEPELTVKVNIKGLKKGTVYLKKAKDSTIIIVDSITNMGSSNFELHSDLESPEVFYLNLDNNDENIVFFADKGITEINTTLKKFVLDAKITGSKQQEKLEEFIKMMSRFNDKNLDLIQADFDAKKAKDTARIKSNQKAFNSLLKSKYLYTVNFAVTNNDSELSPYLALTEIYDANIKWLDTINNVLTPKVKASKYGKELESYIAERKKEN